MDKIYTLGSNTGTKEEISNYLDKLHPDDVEKNIRKLPVVVWRYKS